MNVRVSLKFLRIGMGLSYLAIPLYYLFWVLPAAAFMLVFWWLDPHVVGLSRSFAWHGFSHMAQGLTHIWWFFAWGALLALIPAIIAIKNRESRDGEPGPMFLKGLWMSLNAGFFEEILFRWIFFFNMMVLLQIANVVLFHLVNIVSAHILIPVGNFFSFGALRPELYGYGWIVAAALLLSNHSFQEAHGPRVFRMLNAWGGGMVLFWVMFNYGIWAAIVAHILYDVIMYSVTAASNALRPKSGFTLGVLVMAAAVQAMHDLPDPRQ
jgi:hypothetical protein